MTIVLFIYLDQQIEGNCEHLKSVGFFVENVRKHVIKHAHTFKKCYKTCFLFVIFCLYVLFLYKIIRLNKMKKDLRKKSIVVEYNNEVKHYNSLQSFVDEYEFNYQTVLNWLKGYNKPSIDIKIHYEQ